MASFGKFDDSEFQKWAKQFEQQASAVKAKVIIEKHMRDIAGMAVNQVKKNTYVVSGKLRRSWSASGVKTAGNAVTVDIFNNVEYAPFIEFGHRVVRGGRTVGYVAGQFMLKNTIESLEAKFNREAQATLDEMMRGLFD
jgi:hypothetical protein